MRNPSRLERFDALRYRTGSKSLRIRPLMTNITIDPIGIDGARLTKLTVWEDERGSFFEAFRASWFAEMKQKWVQWNVSRSTGCVVRGCISISSRRITGTSLPDSSKWQLVDLRPKSPTYKVAKLLTLDAADPQGIYIPPERTARVQDQKRDATIMYLVDVEYTGKDEHGDAAGTTRRPGLPKEWYEGRRRRSQNAMRRRWRC